MDINDFAYDVRLRLLNNINAWLERESQIADDMADDSTNAFRYEHCMGRKAGFDMTRQHINEIIEQLGRKDKE